MFYGTVLSAVFQIYFILLFFFVIFVYFWKPDVCYSYSDILIVNPCTCLCMSNNNLTVVFLFLLLLLSLNCFKELVFYFLILTMPSSNHIFCLCNEVTLTSTYIECIIIFRPHILQVRSIYHRLRKMILIFILSHTFILNIPVTRSYI